MNPNSNDPLVMIDNERHLFKVSRSNFTDPEVFAKSVNAFFDVLAVPRPRVRAEETW